jgi:tRNA G18 (ribose-2'-O)-methylase SpoU
MIASSRLRCRSIDDFRVNPDPDFYQSLSRDVITWMPQPSSFSAGLAAGVVVSCGMFMIGWRIMRIDLNHKPQSAAVKRSKKWVLAHQNQTHSRDFFNEDSTPSTSRSKKSIGVVTCDVENPSNSGKICRLLANFGSKGSVFRHVMSHYGEAALTTGAPNARKARAQVKVPGAKAVSAPLAIVKQGAFKTLARGTQKKIHHEAETVAEFSARIATGKNRAPLVVVETAPGARSLFDCSLPAECDILVGGETKGVSPDIMDSLVEGFDMIVFIPMDGFCKSMNVSMCAAAVMCEWARQHDGN